MEGNISSYTVKVSSRGRITLPKAVRDILGVSVGYSVGFASEDDKILIVNPAVYAMQQLQEEMDGEAECTGLTSEEAVMDLVKELRNEKESH